MWEQTRIKEISLIRNLEKTAETLNRLVNYLSDDNKDKADEINRILMINHPLTEDLRIKLHIPFNFYIEGLGDMHRLLEARGFREVTPLPDEDDTGASEWISSSNRKRFKLEISDFLFDEDGKLKFIKKTDWSDDYVRISITDDPFVDDLPF